MTTGVPIYLVSACASGEEFVAAFRRYADKNGLFVPIAAPIPAGRRGRFAVTLSNGGVMIEGDADVVSSATTPSVLHGRVGMTLRFVEPDIKSKTVLIELEQARLAMKPAPPSVPPRPASIPAEPRAVPPKPTGRIDAHNALAECVVIGNLDGLVIPTPIPKSGPKFVVPTIPPVGSGRTKSPSIPPIGDRPPTPPSAFPSLAKPATIAARPATPSTPPPLRPPPAIPSAATPPPFIAFGSQPPAARPPTPATPTPVVAPKPVPPGPSSSETTAVASPIEDPPDAAVIHDTPAPRPEPQADVGAIGTAPHGRPAAVLAVPDSDGDTYPGRLKQDSDTFPISSIPTKPDGIPEPIGSNGGRPGLPPPRRTSGSGPVVPRNPTPASPMPIVRPASITPPRSPTRIGLPIQELRTPAVASGSIALPIRPRSRPTSPRCPRSRPRGHPPSPAGCERR